MLVTVLGGPGTSLLFGEETPRPALIILLNTGFAALVSLSRGKEPSMVYGLQMWPRLVPKCSPCINRQWDKQSAVQIITWP